MYASGICFATISARAPFAPRVEQLASRSIRDAILHPRGSRIERKLEPATPGRCEFHVGNEAKLSFSEKKSQRSECNQPFAPLEGHFVLSSHELICFSAIWRAPNSAEWSDRRRIWNAKRDPIQGQPSAFRAHRCPLRSANHWFSLRKTDDSTV